MTEYEPSKFVRKGERVYSKHEGWPAIDINEPWHVNYGGKKSIRESMLDVNKAFKALAGVFLDEATRLLNKMTDWLNVRYKN